MFALLRPYLDESLDKKKGITFYINGNTVVGYVSQIFGTTAVEVKNRNSSKVLIAIDKIDAVELS